MQFKKFSVFLNRKQKIYLSLYLFNQVIISFLELITIELFDPTRTFLRALYTDLILPES